MGNTCSQKGQIESVERTILQRRDGLIEIQSILIEGSQPRLHIWKYQQSPEDMVNICSFMKFKSYNLNMQIVNKATLISKLKPSEVQCVISYHQGDKLSQISTSYYLVWNKQQKQSSIYHLFQGSQKPLHKCTISNHLNESLQVKKLNEKFFFQLYNSRNGKIVKLIRASDRIQDYRVFSYGNGIRKCVRVSQIDWTDVYDILNHRIINYITLPTLFIGCQYLDVNQKNYLYLDIHDHKIYSENQKVHTNLKKIDQLFSYGDLYVIDQILPNFILFETCNSKSATTYYFIYDVIQKKIIQQIATVQGGRYSQFRIIGQFLMLFC